MPGRPQAALVLMGITGLLLRSFSSSCLACSNSSCSFCTCRLSRRPAWLSSPTSCFTCNTASTSLHRPWGNPHRGLSHRPCMHVACGRRCLALSIICDFRKTIDQVKLSDDNGGGGEGCEGDNHGSKIMSGPRCLTLTKLSLMQHGMLLLMERILITI